MNISLDNIAKQKNELSINSLWEYAVYERFAVVIWRLPKQKNLHFLADFSGKPTSQKIDFDSIQSGFCLSPFINPKGDDTLLLKNDIYFEINENDFTIKVNEQSISTKIFTEKIYAFQEKDLSQKNNNLIKTSPQIVAEEYDNFKNIVTNAIRKIADGEFQKVVLSREKLIAFDHTIDICEAIKKLSESYPNAFVSAIYLPESNHIWIGASPELLVSLDENAVFKTMSLAGTQSGIEKDGGKIDPSAARWSQKEIEEQAYVSRYIIECFKKVRVREYIENGPKTVEAGNLLHLQTTYSVDTKAIEFQQFATVMLNLLHPTSAVCGMPKAEAMQFILENENYEREFYSGFLGPININNSSNIFVNLRSMKLSGNIAHLYAGAGITEDSDSEKEWNETEIKMKTLLNILDA